MCTLDSGEFIRIVKELGQRYKRIGLFKFWNVCCEACLSRTPKMLVDATHLTYDEIVHAHGLSMQGAISMFNSLLGQASVEGEETANQVEIVRSHLQANVRYDSGVPQVHDFAAKLSQLYNTFSPLDNGTVMHINVKDGRTFRVALQGMVFVNTAIARREAGSSSQASA